MRLNVALKSFGLLFFIYTLLRFLFFVFNRHNFLVFENQFILQSFINGWRFDLSAILLLNIPFFLLVFLTPSLLYRTKIFQVFLKIFFVTTNFPFIAANLIDSEYYKFTGNRMTAEIFLFRHEAQNQLDQFIINYWYLGALGLLLLFVLIQFFPQIQWIPKKNKNHLALQILKTTALTLMLSTFLVFGARGGFQPKPLQPLHAYSLAGVSELGVLTLNSTFTILKSKLKSRLSPIYYFQSSEEVLAELKQTPPTGESLPQPQNVVILVLESFATEFWGAANSYEGYTPFLDSLTKKGLFFKNNFANGRRSIDALPAILFGVPSFMSTPIVKTNYHANDWNGLGHIAKRAGRHVSFFHGAPRGTMYFDAISAMAGLDDYYPMERYPSAKDFDGHWGIYDEPFLQFAIKEINQHPQPFLSTVFTISTHQPYHVPPKYEGFFKKGTLDIHESVSYVDYSLKQFFKEAEKQPWFKNTLFIITGDHTQMSASEHYNTSIGRYMVPLLFYHPTQKLPAVDPQRVTQHTDILPSVLDYLDIESEPYLLFGRSVFDQNQEGEAIFSIDDNYWLIHKKYFMHFYEPNQQSNIYSRNDAHQQHPLTNKEALKKTMETRIKSYIQYYKNSLIQNNLYAWYPAKTSPPRSPASTDNSKKSLQTR
jgi:phosphoglycerol transferase MdoB-like AlkP superfamily enzyme